MRLNNSPALHFAEFAARRSAATVNHDLGRGLRSLNTIRQTAPFFGFFGAVFGIMNSFRSFGTSRSTVISLIAGSLGDALLPIMLGLLVYVLAILFRGHLTEQMEEFNIETENAVTFVLNSLARQMPLAPPSTSQTRAPSLRIMESLPFTSIGTGRLGWFEVIWPTLKTPNDAYAVLSFGMALSFLYAAAALLVFADARSFEGMFVSLFFCAAGFAIRFGSRLAAIAITAYLLSAVTFECLFSRFGLGTMIMSLAILPLVGSLRSCFFLRRKLTLWFVLLDLAAAALGVFAFTNSF